MKKLYDFINNQYNQSVDLGIRDKLQLDALNEFYSGNIPVGIQEQFINNPNNDFILEALNSHDTEHLISALKKYYGDDIKLTKFAGNKKIYSIDVRTKDAAKLVEDEQFVNIINFYGYYISDNTMKNVIFIEPTYAHRVKISKNTKVYHFTQLDNVDSILKNGLRCKTSAYRYFPKRIYLYTTNKPIFSDYEKHLYYDVKYFIDTVVRNSEEGYAILKIDVNNYTLPIYHDDAMQDKNATYTYHNIPAEYIKLIHT